MNWLALDIGGANLKAADGLGFAKSVEFSLWRQPDDLASVLQRLIADSPGTDHLAITMTGELADCYRTKSQGVSQILGAVTQATEGRLVSVYGTDGRFHTSQSVLENPLVAAASNWHALARFVCRFLSSDLGLLFDIGSTTTDLVPLSASGPINQAATDPDRLACGELAYTGVVRSPVCALVDQVPWQGKMVRVAQELFATTQDVYVTTGNLLEDPTNLATADGRPLIKEFSRDRLARVICADREMFSDQDAQNVAVVVSDSQCQLLESAAQQVVSGMPELPFTIIVSGQGEFLAGKIVKRLGISTEIISLTNLLGPQVSQAAPAHALAVLARECHLA